MKLSFDATRFGCGLDGAVELAAHHAIASVEYSFAPFVVKTGKGAKSQDDKEAAYFASVAENARKLGVEFSILNLDYALDPLDKRAVKQFSPMLQKLAVVARNLSCPRLGFSLLPAADEDFLAAFLTQYAELKALEELSTLELVMRLAAPPSMRGQSLRKWRPLEPGEWRELLAGCEGLSFSYSPADCLWQGIDYLQNIGHFAQAISHVGAHDMEINRTILGDSGMYGPLWWRYRVAGKGQVDFRQVIELLKLYDFQGSLSMQFEDEFLSDDPLQLSESLEEGVKYFAPLMKG